MDTHAQWTSKRLLAVVYLPSQRSVRPGETTARRVLLALHLILNQAHQELEVVMFACGKLSTEHAILDIVNRVEGNKDMFSCGDYIDL